MTPREKLVARLNALKWRADSKENLKSSSLTEAEAEQLSTFASLHLDTRHTLVPGIQPQSFCLQFPKTDLPKLVARGMKFPGSENVTPEVFPEEEE